MKQLRHHGIESTCRIHFLAQSEHYKCLYIKDVIFDDGCVPHAKNSSIRVFYTATFHESSAKWNVTNKPRKLVSNIHFEKCG